MTNLAYIEHYTIDDYKRWEGDWELIDGLPYAMSPFAKPNHQFVSLQIASKLKELLENCPNCYPLMESEWIVSEDTIVRPDVMVVCDVSLEEAITKTPNLIFEVVSKSSLKRDEQLKFELYRQEGVEYYGLAYLESKRVKLYRLDNGRYTQVLGRPFTIQLDCCEFELELEDIFNF